MLDTQSIRTEMMEFYEQKAAVYGGGGWRAVGEMIGRSGAYARQVANGNRPITSRIAAAWMVATGRQQRMIETPACPDCGGVHTGRCNGISNPVVIVKRQRPAKPAWVVEATANLARLLEET